MSDRRVSASFALGFAATVAVAVWMLGCGRRAPQGNGFSPGELPPSGTVEPFFVGVSSLDVEENQRAGRLFEELSKSLPQEPAVWANLGIARLRLGDLPAAQEAFGTAAKLSPGNDQITVLQATADERQGQFPRAVERLRELPNPPAAVLYQLAELLGRTGRDADPREQLEVFDRIRQRETENLVAAFGRARLLARSENGPALSEAIQAFDSHRQAWSPAALQQLESAQAAAAAGNFRAAATHLTFLQNLSLATPAYQAALSALGATGGSVGRPIRDFLKYRPPGVVVAPADGALQFAEIPEPSVATPPDLYLALALSAKPGASLLSLAGGTLRIGNEVELPVAGTTSGLGRNALCAADLNGDFLQDLALIHGSGLKLWTQDAEGRFTAFRPGADVQPAFETAGHGVWPLDFEADGDLDLLLARDGAAPQILRNNGDGGFTALEVFALFPEVREVCWADFDGDGDGDLALLDVGGRILISWNHRSGAFTAPEQVSEWPTVALACGDISAIGQMDLIALDRGGIVRNLGFDRDKRAWSARELTRWSEPPDLADAFARRRASISVADVDNNGAMDLVASAGAASAIWLSQDRGEFQRLDRAPALFVMSIADVDGDGFLDLAGPADAGAVLARGRGTKGYHWQSIHTRTLATVADGRLNSFGIGGRIEIRAGQLLASAPIVSPHTHFGLGDHSQVGVARIVWPNGVAQVEFDLKADQEITAVQRLKGSCPWVFTRDGDTFRFVKDFIWRSPLGMRINSQDTAGVEQTEDWILIPGERLTVHHGVYEIRITAELWETHFFDHISLMAVDHPESVAVFVDERFVPTRQPKLEVIGTGRPQAVVWARDESGRDVSKALAATDGEYVAGFPLGQFQGIAEDHWLEFEIPGEAPADSPLVLIGEGWIYPTDSSLNVAISQGSHPAPRGLVLEEYDPQRGWRAVSGDLGFPAGKNKTVVIPLPRESLQAGRRRFRLRTNLEVYWDRLAWAVARPDAELKTSPAETLVAELKSRGFSQVAAPDRRKPDLPQYDRLLGTGPRWRDLEGHYTRHGDVRELLQKTDDRYVIMNAGDEFVLRFAAPVPPPAGWTRDFVLIGDGWVKDGDFNTANSRTVHPLPSHALREYGGPPQPLEADPVFQRNRGDWERFHTRYVTPSAFGRGLMNGAGVRARPEVNSP